MRLASYFENRGEEAAILKFQPTQDQATRFAPYP